MSRYKTLLPPLILILILAAITRAALFVRTTDVSSSAQNILEIFVIGAGFDLGFALYILAPIALFLAILPNRAAAWRAVRGFMAGTFALLIFALLFIAAAEWIFWEEFASRFNFIAVDYLIYTHEVIGNIWQSYPVGKILLALAVVALILAALAARFIYRHAAAALNWRTRVIGIALAVIVPVGLTMGLNSTLKNRFPSDAMNELAGNGPYEFFAALRSADLDFMRLYRHLPENEALQRVRVLRGEEGWRSQDPRDFQRSIKSTTAEKRLNVILISVESLGAEYVGAWGGKENKNNLTPRLDALSRESLIFTQMYATGNRTVRGLEALSLSLPPTPGESIVKRPNNAGLFSLGSVFDRKGYDTFFVYGGYGYFDNMNAYFRDNTYRKVVDRVSWPQERTHFENIWGIADEDLYAMSLAQIDAALAASGGQKPVFAHVMTTSNHRPYTYPDGRIDIPSGAGRDGAVKYTDWAIGHFIDEAKKKPWFDNTLFVITADHGANARGTSEIPVEHYLIPLYFYAPKHIKPGRIERVMSQIDIPPTLLGRLHFSYESKFFGHDVLHANAAAERAFVANYQALGYLRDGRMVTLLPRNGARVVAHAAAPKPVAGTATLSEADLIQEAAVWYEAAFIGFRDRLIRDEHYRGN